jgi:hypothetical protein
VTVAARSTPLARAWSARWPIGAEVLLFLALTIVYEFARDLVAVESIERPLRHAQQIIDAERAMGLFVEVEIHEWVQSIGPLDFATTWLYTLGHTAGFAAMFLWVWFRRREWFAAFRNWFWITHVVAVIGYWLYPLAPPRLTDLGLADPTKQALELGGALSWFQPFRNEFAAMPSMHVGYTIIFALALIWMLRPSPWRWLALLWPTAMMFIVMATANHWWLDGVGGLVAVLAGLAIADRLCRDLPRPWARPGGGSRWSRSTPTRCWGACPSTSTT